MHIFDRKVAVPAYAGVIPAQTEEKKRQISCSRVCGGDPRLAALQQQLAELFPRMRG